MPCDTPFSIKACIFSRIVGLASLNVGISGGVYASCIFRFKAQACSNILSLFITWRSLSGKK